MSLTRLDRDPRGRFRPTTWGRIFDNIIITPLPAGGASYDSNPADIHAWDVRTGKPLWTFHVIPHPARIRL